jgi:hypothetical protein
LDFRTEARHHRQSGISVIPALGMWMFDRWPPATSITTIWAGHGGGPVPWSPAKTMEIRLPSGDQQAEATVSKGGLATEKISRAFLPSASTQRGNAIGGNSGSYLDQRHGTSSFDPLLQRLAADIREGLGYSGL